MRRRGPSRCARRAGGRGSGRGAGRRAARRTRRRCAPPGSICPAPRPGTPSISAGWMPWKWIVCGCVEPLTNVIRSRSPSRQRSVGPGTRPLYVHAAKETPGATSISLSAAYSVHSRTTRPLAEPARSAPVEVAQQLVRVEAVAPRGRRCCRPRSAAWPSWSACGVVAPRGSLTLGCLRLVLPWMRVRDGAVEDRQRAGRSGRSDQQSATCKTSHVADCDTSRTLGRRNAAVRYLIWS